MSQKDSNADDLIKRIRRKKLLEQQEEEEEQAKKAAARQQQDTEEDDENLQEDEEEEKRDNSSEEDEEEEDEEEDNDDDEEEQEQEDNDENSDEDNNREDNQDKTEQRENSKDDSKSENSDEQSKDSSDKDNSNNKSSQESSQSNTSTSEDNIGANADSTRGSSSGANSPSSSGATTTSTGGTSSGGTSAGGASTGGASTGGASAGGASAGGASAGGASAGGASAGGAAAGGAAAGGASAGGAAAGGAAAGGAAAGVGLGVVLFWVIVIILIIIILIGIIFFFITMPGSVVGKIGEAINNFRKDVDTFFNGDEAAKIAIGKKEVVDAAQYVSQMGYDLEGFGFLNDEVEDKISAEADDSWWDGLVEWWNNNDEDDSSALDYESFSTKLTAEREKEEDKEYHDLYLAKKYNPNDSESETKSNILMATTEDGEVKYAKSKYLTMYLTADNAVYMIRNYNTSLWNRIKKIAGADNTKQGSGLISFSHDDDVNLDQYVRGARSAGLSLAEADSGIFNIDRAAVFRAEKLLRIYNSDDGWFRDTWFDYRLDGWASKYGVPLQLSLALHLSSLAPDFAYEVAEIGAYDTTVEMGMIETTGNTVKMQVDLDLDGDGTSEKYTIEESYQTHMHKNNDEGNSDEQGYSSIDQAIQFSECEEELAQQQYDTVEEAISKLEEEFKNKSIKFGYFIYHSEYDDAIDKNHWNSASTIDSQPAYIISVEALEELKKISNVLVSYDLATIEKREDGTSYIKVKDENEANTAKIKQLFIENFYLGDIIDKANDISAIIDADDPPDYSNWQNWTKGTEESLGIHGELFGFSNDVTIYFREEVGDTDVDDTYYVPGNLISTTGGEFSTWYNFWQASIENVWDWYFNGVQLGESGHWYDFLIDIVNQWFPIRKYYRLVDEEGNPFDYSSTDNDDFEYINGVTTYWNDPDGKGWFWSKAIPKQITEAIKVQGGLTKAEDVLQIIEKALEVETIDYTKYIPLILEVEDHWYQDVTFKDAYEWNTDEASKVDTYLYTSKSNDSSAIQTAAGNNILYIREELPGKLNQIADGKRTGQAGEKIKNLIDNIKYYKYDGTGKSKEKSKINFADTAVDAIAMLEQIKGEDAQDIIRMFKELMASYDIVFKETEGTEMKQQLFAKVIKDYVGDLLTDGEDCVYRANIPPTQKGFDEELTVQAPCKGKITYKKDDAICIEINEPSQDYDKYTILISGFKAEESLQIGQEVTEGTKLGETIKQDLKLVLRDDNGAIVKNNYVVATTDDGGTTSTTIDSQTAQMYNLTGEQLDILYACVRQEAGTSYESNLAVMSCIMNRAAARGTSPYEEVTRAGQFCYSIDELWKRYLNGNVPATTRKAVRDGLAGTITHRYCSFRTDSLEARANHPNGEEIGGNWYFN